MQNISKVKQPYSDAVEKDMIWKLHIGYVASLRSPNWVQLKSRKTSFGSRKNRPGRSQEHIAAIYDNAIYDIVKKEQNGRDDNDNKEAI